MNYSVFKLQSQSGKPGIFWERESIPKNDRKFGYKKKNQRFPIRRHPGDRGQVDSDLVALTPDEPPAPPPKPAKNFIKRNKEKLAAKGKQDAPNTVTLTQEQLNAILRSVDKKNDTNEITVESPKRRKDEGDYNNDEDNEEFEERREKRRNKKRPETKEEDESGAGSIYALLGDSKSKPKNTSDKESYDSDESLHMYRRTKPRKMRKDRQSRRKYDEDDEPDNRAQKSRSRKTYNDDDDIDDDDRDIRKRRSKSINNRKYASDEEEEELVEIQNRRNRSKPKHLDEDDDLDDEKENRRRNKKSKRRDNSYDDDIDNREIDRRNRTRKYDKSHKDDHSVEKRDRSEKRAKGRQVSKERDSNAHNTSLNKTDDEENVSPRDKVGLPMDLSWRHMSKAERKRLDMARQRLIDEEEKREEERIRQLQAKYGGVSNEPKRIVTRSDPATRLDRPDRGRETDLSNRTDHYRRDRRSLSPIDRSPDRSPEVPSHLSPDASPKVMPIPKRHMTLAEKKRLEWERERVESQIRERQEVDPWGRPGAGAPLRTKSGHVAAEYRGRQSPNDPTKEHMKSITIEEEPDDDLKENDTQPLPPKEKKRTRHHSPPPPQQASLARPEGENLPHALRSSFILGQAAPDYHKFNETKEKERKQWLAELEKQIEDKKASELKIAEDNKVVDTWADKLGLSHRPVQLPEPSKGLPATDVYSVMDTSVPIQDTHRTSSAPGESNLDESQTYIRGQNAPIDPVTKKELEEKRRKYLEHQMAVKAQVEEKERLKRLERERKMKEDMEEERKLQAERELLQKQFEGEQQKMRQKEAQRQAQVNQLKAAMDEAHAKALQEKYQRKMQHLEAGGHDTTKLREHLEGIAGALTKITPRSDPPNTGVIHVAPTHVPGLDLSTARTNLPQLPDNKWETGRTNHPQFSESKGDPDHEPYTEDRVLTPSRFRHPSKPWSDPSSPRREFGTQTVEDVTNLLNASLPRQESDVQIEYRMDKRVRVVSAPKESVQKRQPDKRTSRSKDRSPQFREQPSPHQHHHEVQKRREQIEAEKKKKLEEARRKGSVKPGSRPKWGYKNMDNKKPQKNSEKDPFYEKKKRESQMRRYQREQKLLAMVEANKEVIPKYHVPPPRSRDQSPYSDYEHESIREARVSRRSKSHSPHRTLSDDRADYYDDMSKPPQSISRRKTSRSPSRERSESPIERHSRTRHKSPPIPAIKHRNDINQNYGGAETRRTGGKYGDPIQQQNGQFVPFTRTIDVLDPARADDPLPLSREATLVANARKQYFENLHPDKYGNRQSVYQDAERNPLEPKNPLMNPSLVLDHPTSRQDQILIQLSTLKQSLMQRQRELETFSPSDLEKQDIPVH